MARYALILSVVGSVIVIMATLMGCNTVSNSQKKASLRTNVVSNKTEPEQSKTYSVPRDMLKQAGLESPASIKMVIYQRSGYANKLEESFIGGPAGMVLAPFKYPPVEITESSKINAFYNAIKNAVQIKCDAKPRIDRLAFVTQDSRVVIFGVDKATAGSQVLITSELSSIALSELLLQSSHENLAPTGLMDLQIDNISYSDGFNTTNISGNNDKRRLAEKLCRELMSHFSPIALKGNLYYNKDDIAAFYYTEGLPGFLKIKLRHPISVGVVILPEYLNHSTPGAEKNGWPPTTFDANGRMETVNVDIVHIYQEDGAVRFALLNSTNNYKGLFTDPIMISKRLEKRLVALMTLP